MKKYTKLSVAVLAGAMLATSSTGTAFAVGKNLQTNAPVTASSENIDQSDSQPKIQTQKADIEKTKTIDLKKDDVNILGASWDGETNPDLKIRYQTAKGWSNWETLPEDDKGGPDKNSAEGKRAEKFQKDEKNSTEAVPIINSTKVQIKAGNQNADVEDLKITNVSTKVTEEDKEIASRNSTPDNTQNTAYSPGQMGVTSGGTPIAMSNVTTGNTQTAYTQTISQDTTEPNITPEDPIIAQSTYNPGLKANIVTRKEWGANESLKKCSASTTPSAKGVYIHHTAGSNSYTKAQAPGIIRGYLSYHTQSRGWCDLGYNFLVDKYGTIYEGRAGSIDKAVVGSHASGFNSQTIGISVMGTYTGSAPSTSAQNSVKRIIAWKANQYGFNPTGKMTLTSGGGDTSKYKAGQKVTLNVVSGHRDTSYTSCPGTAFYNRLSSIRNGAKSLQSQLQDNNYRVGGAIGSYYYNNKSRTGEPKSNEYRLTNPNGAYQVFSKGVVYWSNKTGAHFNTGAIRTKYGQLKYEKGSLGYPTTDEVRFKYKSDAVYQNYERGMITWSNKTGAHPLKGAIQSKWKSLGWERSKAKLPTQAERCGLKNKGCYQAFEGGSIHWSPASGAHFTIKGSGIQTAWKRTGYENGRLGYPTSEEYKVGKQVRQNFQGGYITWESGKDTKVTYR